MRLIDADKLVSVLQKRAEKAAVGDGLHKAAVLFAYNVVRNIVKKCPTIDPVEVHGQWLKHEIVVDGKVTFAEDTVVCSRCQDIWRTSTKMKYCPSCGARMDGEVNG